MVVATRTSSAWERYAWVTGILCVIALLAESVVSIGVGVNQDDSAAKIANALHKPCLVETRGRYGGGRTTARP